MSELLGSIGAGGDAALEEHQLRLLTPTRIPGPAGAAGSQTALAKLPVLFGIAQPPQSMPGLRQA